MFMTVYFLLIFEKINKFKDYFVVNLKITIWEWAGSG